MSEDLPFGTNGGLAVRHTFPLDGEYAVRVLLPGMGSGYFYSGRRASSSSPWTAPP